MDLLMDLPKDIPKDVLHIILEMDGRIAYRHGKYVRIIHKHDERYAMIEPLIRKKRDILHTIHIDDDSFYFEFGFDGCAERGLCYDVGFNAPGRFEICYFDFREDWKQIRTYL